MLHSSFEEGVKDVERIRVFQRATKVKNDEQKPAIIKEGSSIYLLSLM